MKMHFISGLPRSGSTLLASILRQNPRFHASIMTPVGQIVTDMVQSMGPKNEASSYITDAQRAGMLRGVFDNYYGHMPAARDVIFDNNRRWTANAALTAHLYPDSLILCCVRDPRAIIDSFERLFQKHPTHLSVAHGAMANTTVYERVNKLMEPTGVVGFSLNAFRSAFFGQQQNRLLLINYEDLCQFPDRLIPDLYTVLGEEQFEHDYTKISNIDGASQFDRDIDTPDLHTLKPAVVYEPRNTILPPDILAVLPGPFWRVNETATSGG